MSQSHDPTVEDTAISNTVTLRCDTGYEVNGTDLITCEPTAKWPNVLPECVLPTQPNPACPAFPQVQNGTVFVVESNGTVGISPYMELGENALVMVTCNNGYRLVNASDDEISVTISATYMCQNSSDGLAWNFTSAGRFPSCVDDCEGNECDDKCEGGDCGDNEETDVALIVVLGMFRLISNNWFV